jgi:hypothetical protein
VKKKLTTNQEKLIIKANQSMGGQLADAVGEIQKRNTQIANLEDAILQLKINVLDQAAVINYLEKKVMK